MIRKAFINDSKEIYNIESQVYGNHGWSYDVFKTEIKRDKSIYLVYETEDIKHEIIGYIGAWIVLDEGHITTLVVCPKYRRNHIADILLYNLIHKLLIQNIKWLTLEVKVSNMAAISLYKKFGFKEIGIRKKYYEDNNEDALILWTENIHEHSFINNMEDIKAFISKNSGILINPVTN